MTDDCPCTCQDAGWGLWIEDGCEMHDHDLVNERTILKLQARIKELEELCREYEQELEYR